MSAAFHTKQYPSIAKAAVTLLVGCLLTAGIWVFGGNRRGQPSGILPSTTSASSKHPSPDHPSSAPNDAIKHELLRQEVPPHLQGLAQRISCFAQSGDVAPVANLTVAEIQALTNWIETHFSRAVLADLLFNCSRLPPEFIPKNPIERATYLAGWFNALRGDPLCDGQTLTAIQHYEPTPIAFSGHVDQAEHVQSTSPVMDRRNTTIYGVFDTSDWRPEVCEVLTIWRKIDEGKVVFQRTEPLMIKASSNYVWLKSNENWPTGHWRVDLFDPSNFLLLATGNFETR